MKALTITVSFKNTDAELQIYNFLLQKSSFSGYIKDVIKKEMEKENEKK